MPHLPPSPFPAECCSSNKFTCL
uniref:Uncharacterized protein n=1 Tax=Arundo donax TaxID=35708 RepID=A0A0A9C827_ARUDO